MKSVHDMITYLDTETDRDTRYEVVSYLLAHLRDLDSLSLTEVARQTYVSKSTVSRVVRRFGFDSYDEFLAVTRRLVGQDPSSPCALRQMSFVRCVVAMKATSTAISMSSARLCRT